jgi:DNA-binding response OmpR family regulator
MRILFVEDEVKVTEALKELCTVQKIDCDIANDGDEGLMYALKPVYDVVILDIMLPGINGLDILKEMRQKEIHTPVLMLTAKDTIDDKVKGLDYGADDYMVKPFSAKELFARIRALSRRVETEIKKGKIVLEDVTIDEESNILEIEDKTYNLSFKEAKLFEMFIKRPDQVFTREQILDRVWGFDSEVNENNIEIYVHNLRKKLKKSKLKIDTVRGIGYKLRVTN